jgi:hypothetical protein
MHGLHVHRANGNPGMPTSVVYRFDRTMSHIQDYNRGFKLLWWNLPMLYGRWDALQNDGVSPRMSKPPSHSIKELYGTMGL